MSVPAVSDVLLMSPPRADWRVHGRANVFSQGAAATPERAVEKGAALREWLVLADAIEEAGAHVVILPWGDDDDTLTGMPYTAEAGAIGRSVSGVGAGAPGARGDARVWLLPNVKPPHRRGEAARIEALAAAWGLRTHQVPVPWEGQGDIIDIGPSPSGDGARSVCTSGEGPYARTSFEAFERVAPYLDGEALHVRFRADPWFHGNTFVARFTAADASARVIVVCDEALFPGERARLDAFVAASARDAGDDARVVGITRAESLQYGTNALQVGTRVLAPAGAPPTLHALWRSLGLDVKEIALPTLFGKGGGAAVCLTNRLALAVDDVPLASRYASVRPSLVAALASAA